MKFLLLGGWGGGGSKSLVKTCFTGKNKIYVSRSHISGFFFKKCISFLFYSRFNLRTNYNYDGQIPDVTKFYLFSDTKDVIGSKKIFVDNFENKKWNFREQIISCLANEVLVLAKACLTFIKNSFDFQAQLKEHLKMGDNLICHPFGDKMSSLSAFSQKQFSYYYMNKHDIYGVKYEYTGGLGNISRSL